MPDEFIDSVEYRLRNDPRMMEFWESLERQGIGREKGRAFLDRVWAATMIDSWPLIEHGGERYFRALAQQLKEADKLARKINDLAASNPIFFQPVPLPERDEEDQRVVAAFASRKENPGLHLALYLIDDALKILGKPSYDAVAVAVSVALSEWVEDDVDPATLKTSRNRSKPKD